MSSSCAQRWCIVSFCFGLLATTATPAAALTIAEVVARARSAPPQAAAAARMRAAQGSLTQAGALPNPTLEVRQENLSDDSGWSAAHTLPLDFFATLTQPLELGGKRRTRRAIAGADLNVATAEVAAVTRALAVEAVRHYLAALQSRDTLLATVEQRSALQVLIDGLQRRVDAGHVAEADVLKLRTEAARLDTLSARARLTLGRRLEALAVLLGSASPIDAAVLQVPQPLSPPAGEIEELVATALARLPEIDAAQARLDRARQMIGLERAQRLPDPNLTAGYKRTAGADTIVAGISLALPVFDLNQGNIARAIAEQQAAALELDHLRRERRAETVALLTAARELAERATRVHNELVAPAEAVRHAARSAFGEGASDVLPLVDAERVYREARREALDLTLEAYARAFEAHSLLNPEFRP